MLPLYYTNFDSSTHKTNYRLVCFSYYDFYGNSILKFFFLERHPGNQYQQPWTEKIESGTMTATQSVQVFGKKKTATAVAFAKQGRGLIKVNGQPLENIEPEALRLKIFEPVLIVGEEKFSSLDIRVRVKGGGITAQMYAIRAAIAKSIVAYHAKYVDEQSKNELRKTLIDYDRSILVSDPRRCEPKKYGGRSARARFQKSYR